jgi:hypothetical protein
MVAAKKVWTYFVVALVAFAADCVVFLTAALPFIAIVAVIAAVIRGTRRVLKRFRK